MRTPYVDLLLVSLALSAPLRADIVLSEIMYNPPQGEEHEYIELYNTASVAVSVGGWAINAGVLFTFPPEATIPADGYVVLCASVTAFQTAYPDVPAAQILGEYTGRLDNGGETLRLVNDSGATEQSFTYDDDAPWEFLADGFGASLERACLILNPNSIENWRASEVPESESEFGGSPAMANAVSECPPVLPERPRVLISEIMYHPVLEDDLVDNHEFVELYSLEDNDVDLSGWRLSGSGFLFPPGSSISAGEYVVVAKNPSALIAEYGLAPSLVLGGYPGVLDNGGEKLALIGAGGQGIDSVSYDDDAPWPIGADALGAGESWLDASLLPIEDHRYRGHSLERVSFNVASGEISNWTPSPLDGPTPGAINAGTRPTPRPVVADLDVVGSDPDDPLVRSGETVTVRALFSPPGLTSDVELEYFVDDVAIEGETGHVRVHARRWTGRGRGSRRRRLHVRPPGYNPRTASCGFAFSPTSEVAPESSSPRAPTDPNSWWNVYFVSPNIAGVTRALPVVHRAGSLDANSGTNIGGPLSAAARPNANWNAKVPAVFVFEGDVFDARVRLSGKSIQSPQWAEHQQLALPRTRPPEPGPRFELAYLPFHATNASKDAVLLPSTS